MKKKIAFALLGCMLLLGILALIKWMQVSTMMAMSRQQPPETVTTFQVREETWESVLTAVGSVVAMQGTTIAAELTGKVAEIAFEPGSIVQQGVLLVQQDISAESAQLRAAEASAELARLTFERSKKLLAEGTIAQSDFDTAQAQYKQASAQVDNLRALVSKKTIRAPFTGQVGIRQISVGQMLSPGDALVSLQSLDPLYVNFSLPQQQLSRIRTGLRVRIQSDALPDRSIEGTITAINPEIDAATRTVAVQATVHNPDLLFRPGMFVSVTVVLPEQERVLAVPATAVLNAPYSDSVFIVEERTTQEGGAAEKIVRQQFVRLGMRRGDFVAITAGLKPGDIIVSTGVFKLRNDQPVTVDNTLTPTFTLSPAPPNR
ncbi:MAG: efflux RND transporter periplasmic adaptor subunit [Desulfobacterota bacterium]|nr:efflux RND transporter periplasmic adaptor subunit [Thermodesulfobacteriota bacterium]